MRLPSHYCNTAIFIDAFVGDECTTYTILLRPHRHNSTTTAWTGISMKASYLRIKQLPMPRTSFRMVMVYLDIMAWADRVLSFFS